LKKSVVLSEAHLCFPDEMSFHLRLERKADSRQLLSLARNWMDPQGTAGKRERRLDGQQ
jgi:hypothetical protein